MLRTQPFLIFLIFIVALAFGGGAYPLKSGTYPTIVNAQTPPQISRWYAPVARDTVATYPEANNTPHSRPYVLSSGGNTLTFDTDPTWCAGCDPVPNFITYSQCPSNPYPPPDPINGYRGGWVACDCNQPNCVNPNPPAWVGNFAPGTKVLLVDGWYLEISFASPISEVGFQVQSVVYERQRYTVHAFNGSTDLGSILIDDIWDTYSSTPLADGHAPFIGIRANCGSVITKIQVSGSFDIFGPYFASGPVYFGSYSTAIPAIPPSP